MERGVATRVSWKGLPPARSEAGRLSEGQRFCCHSMTSWLSGVLTQKRPGAAGAGLASGMDFEPCMAGPVAAVPGLH
jgi:hypothetical protein